MKSTADSSHFAHLGLFIWIHARHRVIRSRAIDAVTKTLARDLRIIEQVASRFYQSVANGCTSQHMITQACLRDLADEKIINGELYNVSVCIHYMRPQLFRLETRSEVQVIWKSLAAARRQFCMGDPGANMRANNVYNIMVVLCAFLTYVHVFLRSTICFLTQRTPRNVLVPDTAPRVPESQAYGIISLTAKHLIPTMTGRDSRDAHGMSRTVPPSPSCLLISL